VLTVLILYPLVWMVFESFKTSGEFSTNVWGPPQSLQWINYVNAWNIGKLGYALVNSTIVSLSVVVLVIVSAGLAAYAITKMKFRFGNAVFFFFIFTMSAPAPIIPLYAMLVALRLTDTYGALILPAVAGGIPFSVFMFRAYYLSLPSELIEAAKVDGCTDLSAFLRIVVPISGPAIATVAILQFIGTWNEYFLPLIMIRTPEMRTIPLAIQAFFYQWGRTEWQQVFAALSIGTIPIVVLYYVMQRQFIQGLTAGAIKA
jgi:raffinose/stachyose/melibiose transport system permease protein